MPRRAGDSRLRWYAALASSGVAVTLVGAKLWAFLDSNSAVVLVSLIDSAIDLVASALILLSIIYAQRPPDHLHRFGHGKAEPLAALLQAGFIAGSAVMVAIEGLSRFLDPGDVGPVEPASVVLLAGLALTGALVVFQGHVVKRTGSPAIAADRAHYAGDVVMTLSIIATLFIADRTGIFVLDTVFALGAAAYWLFMACRLTGRSLGLLLDREISEQARARIEALVHAHPEAIGIHDLRTRSDGTRVFIEFHLELTGSMSLTKAHDVADAIERDIAEAFGGAEVLIHQEPAGLVEDRLDERLR